MSSLASGEPFTSIIVPRGYPPDGFTPANTLPAVVDVVTLIV